MLAAHRLHVWGVPYDRPHRDAVLHTRVQGRDVEVRLARDANGTVRVEVSDADPSRPEPVTAAPEAERGRGLLLVDAVASRWGVARRTGLGKTVRVDLDRP